MASSSRPDKQPAVEPQVPLPQSRRDKSKGKAKVVETVGDTLTPQERSRAVKIGKLRERSELHLQGKPKYRDLGKFRDDPIGKWTCDFFKTGDKRAEWKALFDNFKVKPNVRPLSPKTICKRYGIDPQNVTVEQATSSKVMGTIVSVGQLDCGLRFPLAPFASRLLSVSGLCPGQLTGNAQRIIHFFNRVESDHRAELRECYNSIPDQEDARIELGYFFHHYRWFKGPGIFYTLLGNKGKCRPVDGLEQSDKEYNLWPVSVSGDWCSILKVPDAPQTELSDMIQHYTKDGKFAYTAAEALPFDRLFFSLTRNTRLWKHFKYCPIQSSTYGRFEKTELRDPDNDVCYSDYDRDGGRRPLGLYRQYPDGTIRRFREARRHIVEYPVVPSHKRKRGTDQGLKRFTGTPDDHNDDDDDDEATADDPIEPTNEAAAGSPRTRGNWDAVVNTRPPKRLSTRRKTCTEPTPNVVLPAPPPVVSTTPTVPTTTPATEIEISPTTIDPELEAARQAAEFDLDLSEMPAATNLSPPRVLPQAPPIQTSPSPIPIPGHIRQPRATSYQSNSSDTEDEASTDRSEAGSTSWSDVGNNDDNNPPSKGPSGIAAPSPIELVLEPDWSSVSDIEPVIHNMLGSDVASHAMFRDRLFLLLQGSMNVVFTRAKNEWKDRVRQMETDILVTAKRYSKSEGDAIVLKDENVALKAKVAELEKSVADKAKLEADNTEQRKEIMRLDHELQTEKTRSGKLESTVELVRSAAAIDAQKFTFEKSRLEAKVASLSEQVKLYKEATDKAKAKMYEAADRLKKERAINLDLQIQLGRATTASAPTVRDHAHSSTHKEADAQPFGSTEVVTQHTAVQIDSQPREALVTGDAVEPSKTADPTLEEGQIP